MRRPSGADPRLGYRLSGLFHCCTGDESGPSYSSRLRHRKLLRHDEGYQWGFSAVGSRRCLRIHETEAGSRQLCSRSYRAFPFGFRGRARWSERALCARWSCSAHWPGYWLRAFSDQECSRVWITSLQCTPVVKFHSANMKAREFRLQSCELPASVLWMRTPAARSQRRLA